MRSFKPQSPAQVDKSSLTPALRTQTKGRTQAKRRRNPAGPLDRAALVLGVVAALLILCLVVAVVRKPATLPAAVAEKPAVKDRLLPETKAPLAARPERDRLDEAPTTQPSVTQPSATQSVPQEPEVARLIEEPETRVVAQEPIARPEVKPPKAEPVVAEPKRPEPRPEPIVIKKNDPEMRRWTHESGDSFQGKFLRFRDNKVVIQALDDSVKEVHPSQLSTGDREWYTSILKAKRVAEGDERRARAAQLARTRRASRPAVTQRVIPWAQTDNGSNQWNFGSPAANFFPMGNNYYPSQFNSYPYANYGGFGFGGPQHIRRHIYIAPSNQNAQPERQPQPQSQQLQRQRLQQR